MGTAHAAVAWFTFWELNQRMDLVFKKIIENQNRGSINFCYQNQNFNEVITVEVQSLEGLDSRIHDFSFTF
jgi:hypothetical protein